MLLIFMGLLSFAALWFVSGILRDQHHKTTQEMREIRQLDRDLARVIRQSKPRNGE